MKTTIKFKYILLSMIMAFAIGCNPEDGEDGAIGPQGEQGIQGLTGENGNANVQAFDLVVNKTDWETNLHYGGGNIYRAYRIAPERVGGIDIGALSDDGGAVLLYAFIEYDDAAYQSERERKQLPFITTVSNMGVSFGLRMEFSISRNSLLMAKTENGWDAKSVPDEDVPDNVEVRLVLIEGSTNLSGKIENQSVLETLKKEGVNLENYEEVMDYFGLDY